MPRRGIGTDHDQTRSGTALVQLGQHIVNEPFERFLVGKMAEASQKQQRVGLPAVHAKLITRSIDACAQVVVNPPFQLRDERLQVEAILAAAHLHPVRMGQTSVVS
jgi:23S rRNA A2030 N6-methylase RlmJ